MDSKLHSLIRDARMFPVGNAAGDAAGVADPLRVTVAVGRSADLEGTVSSCRCSRTPAATETTTIAAATTTASLASTRFLTLCSSPNARLRTHPCSAALEPVLPAQCLRHVLGAVLGDELEQLLGALRVPVHGEVGDGYAAGETVLAVDVTHREREAHGRDHARVVADAQRLRAGHPEPVVAERVDDRPR